MAAQLSADQSFFSQTKANGSSAENKIQKKYFAYSSRHAVRPRKAPWLFGGRDALRRLGSKLKEFFFIFKLQFSVFQQPIKQPMVFVFLSCRQRLAPMRPAALAQSRGLKTSGVTREWWRTCATGLLSISALPFHLAPTA